MNKREFNKSVNLACGAVEVGVCSCVSLSLNYSMRMKYTALFRDHGSPYAYWLHEQIKPNDIGLIEYRLMMLEFFRHYCLSEGIYKEF